MSREEDSARMVGIGIAADLYDENEKLYRKLYNKNLKEIVEICEEQYE